MHPSHRTPQILIALTLGALVFYAAFGLNILNPDYTAWLMHGDPAQHYFGWAFFRQEDWHWPPGLLLGYAAPLQTSIVFTDSIPLLALPLKALSPLLPPTFQYFGLWILACYLLLALFAWHLLARLIPTPTHSASALRLMGVALILLSPPLLLRGYGHEALMAHWLILAAINETLNPHRSRRWALWLAIALLTHAYLAVMVAAFWFASLVHALIQRSPSAPQLIFGSLILWSGLIALAYLAGYIVPGSSQLVAQGYGHYSANLLTYFDPMDWQAFLNTFQRSDPSAAEWSRLLPPLGHAHHDQYEGFAYLGLGGILLLGTALALLPKRPHNTDQAPRPTLAPALLMAAALFILGLSTTITLGKYTLTSFSFPAPLQHLLEIFRASGRFVWPLYYLILILGVAALANRLRPPFALPILALIVSLQAYDLAPKFAEFHRHHQQSPILQSINTDHWPKLQASTTQLIVLPRPQGDTYLPWAHLAHQHDLSLNLGIVARADNATLQAQDQSILHTLNTENAPLPAHSLIIITDQNIPIHPTHLIKTDSAHPTWRIIQTP